MKLKFCDLKVEVKKLISEIPYNLVAMIASLIISGIILLIYTFIMTRI
jgi:hypothetical protein